MPHETPLIATIVGSLVLAFIFGTIATRLRLSPLVGYLLAGIVAGPFTPGYVADQHLAPELAEIGVILLMFGVGLHFSWKDLLAVKNIAVPGAVIQIGVATLMGLGLTTLLGWNLGAGIVFGLALSVASTVVLLRELQERHLLDSERGRIAVGWLVVEDLVMVLVLVLLPALSGVIDSGGSGGDLNTAELIKTIGLTLGKVAAFIVLMLVVGRRVIPWLLHYIAQTGSRELFRLAVLAISLGVAFGAAALFGVSFALGAFFAGMVLSESDLSHQAAQETLPLRDAFAVLFFVSVGMLFDPTILIRSPLPVLAAFLIIVFGKSVAAFAIVRLFRHSTGTALTISASLAQIGEFSFILATFGVDLGLMPSEGRDYILAGAILSILANPLLFMALDRRKARQAAAGELNVDHPDDVPAPITLSGHVVVVGYGRVGQAIVTAALLQDLPVAIIETNRALIDQAIAGQVQIIIDNGAKPDVVEKANLAAARCLFVAVPNGFEAGQITKQARAMRADLPIIVRAHSAVESAHLSDCGASEIILEGQEIGRAMADAFFSIGRPDQATATPLAS
ncbi:MAG TPA: YbaL family putative K(+) efflux transporter [Terriglobales bacterium]|nr:YbaL family putative K(+) efflux transporter [Terriglobales bacterium]